MSFVNKSLVRQCRQNKNLPRFRLSVSGRHYFGYYERINEWVGLISRHGLKELDPEFHQLHSPYPLPQSILSHDSLTVLRLSGCQLTGLPFGYDSVTWPSLIELSLRNTHIDDAKIIDNLSLTCPLIQKLTLVSCSDVNNLRLSGFARLREVKVIDTALVDKEICIFNLPSLQYLSCGFSKVVGEEYRINDLAGCEALEVLKLKYIRFTNSMIVQLLPQLSALKTLVLWCCPGLRRVTVKNRSLEKLHVVSAFDQELLMLDAPSLRSLKHTAQKKLPALFLSSNMSTLRTVSVRSFSGHKIGTNCGFLEGIAGYLGSSSLWAPSI
ncbi:hypothetical protein Tsubulata_031808 [Turnera subulata]|uniref:F-box/LRR-repeat protein 15/At3g58940/PEG3-like LRR domain-containing protein n=1 Tax=Turnera subulata TaxID=218843 RepID=A0A9Q0GK70_9ROSI|nr:hypothetical protein Tsubulata_031808 [Turnera subulata]